MKKLNLTLIFLCVLQLSYAQETIPSTGGNASGTGGASSYTVGQLVYTTNISIAGSIPSFIELVVDPPGSSTNPTTQPRLTINDVGSQYPH